MNSKEKALQAKQEGDVNDSKFSKTTASTSRQWAGLRNPRIVRVSRSFGGKDRHSKVCTIRGLRDRRIRLSVPTAIQLYDLQERLGVSQPSKVVDWLLDATKSDIDKLPPLQIQPGSFSQFNQAISSNNNIPPQFFGSNPSYKKDVGPQSFLSNKGSGGLKISEDGIGKEKWIPSNDVQEEGVGGYNAAQITAQNFFPVANQSSFPTLLHNMLPMQAAYNPFYQWDGGNSNIIPMQTEVSQSQNNTLSQGSSSMALPSGSHQLYFCPSAATFPTIVPSMPPYMTASHVESSDQRQSNHFQFLSSSSQHHVHQANNNSLMQPTLHLISSPLKSLRLNSSDHPKNILQLQEKRG